MKNYFTTRTLIIILAFIVLLLIFEAGVFAGFHRARFGYRMHTGGFPHVLFNGPGIVGTIQTVLPNSITITTRDGSSQTIQLATSTIIRGGYATSTRLMAGEHIIAIGSESQSGTITAKLIRIFASSTPMMHSSFINK
jgi:hypothetical protein